MVTTNPYLIKFSGLVLPKDAKDREIRIGPLWNLEEVIRIASITTKPPPMISINRKCTKDLAALESKGFVLSDAIKSLTSSQYNGSEWCESTNGPYLHPCDVYIKPLRARNMLEEKYGAPDLYLKFCRSLHEESLLLFLSIHE